MPDLLVLKTDTRRIELSSEFIEYHFIDKHHRQDCSYRLPDGTMPNAVAVCELTEVEVSRMLEILFFGPEVKEQEYEREQKLQEIAALYFRQCGAYDRRICSSCSNRTNEPIPSNMDELRLINRNARIVFDELVQRFGISPQQLHHAISSYE